MKPHTPNHIAIIPDGNRRWAKSRGMLVSKGHEEGINRFRPILRATINEGIPCLSAWMCSKDNLTKRPKEEVAFLYRVFQQLFDELGSMPEIDTHRIRVQAFGEWETSQPPALVHSIRALMERTKTHDQFFLNLFDAYDGVSEMTRAVDTIARRAVIDPQLRVTPELIKASLYTADLPPVDLVIRTGGEPHWSGGFMMWDIANAQMHFSQKMWPEFTQEDYLAAIDEYRARDRRHGK